MRMRFASGIDLNAFHRRQIYDESAIAYSVACETMAA